MHALSLYSLGTYTYYVYVVDKANEMNMLYIFSSVDSIVDVNNWGIVAYDYDYKSFCLWFFVQAYNLSRDHKPDLEAEKERIIKAGGFIHAGRVNGSLNLARAIGILLLYLI